MVFIFHLFKHNRLGMLIDISHTSYKTQLDVLELSKTPVIFSHSNVYNLCNHTRNVKDSVLLKLVCIFLLFSLVFLISII